MMAHIAPNDDDSQTHQTSKSLEQAFTYGDQSSISEVDADYVPEREFVLMPLFRRIGDMLGIRRAEQPEYIYVPEQVTPQPELAVARQPEGILTATRADTAEASLIAPLPPAEDVLGLESEIEPEPAIVEARPESELQSVPEEPEWEPQPQTLELAPEPVLQAEQHEQELEPKSEPLIVEAPPHMEPVLAQSQVEIPQAVTAVPVLTQKDANELVAQIRESAVRISAALAQAAEWFYTKEQEVLRRAEMPLAPEKPVEQKAQTWLASPVSAQPQISQVPEWNDQEAPAIQRELAWQEAGNGSIPDKAVALAALNSKAATDAKAQKSRLQLVSNPPALPIWQRIDWSKQFAPKRVAIMGAVVMAVLIILGISLARSSAPENLPKQTRAVEPGGVTLTSHPATTVAVHPASAVAAPVPAERKPAISQPETHPRPHGANRHEDGPEVVTHYYGKPKPSPIPQSAAAGGVRHYSDMQ